MTSRRRAARMRRSAATGMTLIEVLVALALLAMLSVGLTTAFRVGQHAYERITKMDRSYSDVVVAQRFLRNAFESAYPFEPTSASAQPTRGIDGAADRLSLTAWMGLGNASAGHRRYVFSLARRGNGRTDLVATSNVDRNGGDADEASTVPPETVIAGIAGVEWSYYDPAMGAAGWRSSWSERKPPALVRLRVAFPIGDSREWPDLVVAPRVTDDANCQFDVVAQACREVGR